MESTHTAAWSTLPLTRLVSSALTAATVTFALFVMMHQLVKAPTAVRPEPTPVPPVRVHQTPDDTPTITRPRLTPPPELVQPERMSLSSEPVDTGLDMTPGVQLKLDGLHSEPVAQSGLGIRDAAATPMVRVEPRYPVEAARQGISGWVQLRFSVDESGQVQDVEVIAAEPATIFNREAMRALRRWRYQPKLVDGRAVRQTNLQVQLDFTLDAN